MNIYHLFDASRKHHTPKFMKLFIAHGKEMGLDYGFILYNYDKSNFDVYKDFEEQLEKTKFITIPKDGLRLKQVISNICRQKNRIIIHGFRPNNTLYLILFFNKRLLKNISWVCWGAGLNVNFGFLQSIKFKMKKKLYNSFHSINSLLIGDKRTLEEIFMVSPNKIFNIPYWNILAFNTSQEIKSYFNDNRINILIGHNGDKNCKHIELLKKIKKFSGENIRVINFLNYGVYSKENERYKQEVVDIGYKLFEDKYLPFLELLSFNEYESIMKGINVLLIPQRKQAALGAVYRTILSSGVVYLDRKGKNFEWLKFMGIKTANLNDEFEDFSSFIKPLSVEERSRNIEHFMNFMNEKKLKKAWKGFFLE